MPRRVTLESFVQRARVKHGLAYLYTAVVLLTMKDKVEIICPTHGSFWQRPNKHCSGDGCPACGKDKFKASKTLPYTVFLQRAQRAHADKYDYSKVMYIDYSTKIEILCSSHGVFTQTPETHCRGSGCPKCHFDRASDTLRASQAEFVEKCRQVHGNMFDYSDSVYVNNHTPVSIRCIKHNLVFEQRPSNHINRADTCPKCSPGKHSRVACEWLNALAVTRGVYIQHAENGQEFQIPGTRFKADGYCAAVNTVFEFFGSYYHGDPTVFAAEEHNDKVKKTMGELYQKTMERLTVIEDLGFKVEYIWEKQWQAAVKNAKEAANSFMEAPSNEDVHVMAVMMMEPA